MMMPASVVPPPQLTTSASPPLSPQSTSPTSTRSRIRAFNYLRGHHHSAPPTPVPPPPPEPVAAMTATIRQVLTNSASADEQHPQQQPGTTSWLPTVGGVSGLARVPSTPSADGAAPATQDPFSNNPLYFQNHTGSAQGIDGPSERTPTPAINAVAGGPKVLSRDSTPAAQPNGLPDGKVPTIRFVPHVDPRSTRRPHTFAPMERSIKSLGEVVKVGRFSDRDNSNPVGFKSKVVSRRHCEFWWSDGSWYMKDVGSSSGTFLNHVRLSHPNTESKPYAVHDGDVVQLGIDFKGGEELIFRCVKMKLELNRDAKSINQFNVAAHRRIQNLGKPSVNKGAAGSEAHAGECAICLLNIAPCQPLFVAPCSHVWHYKCIRPIIEQNFPILPCPNCREIADLEAEIEEANDENWEDMDKVKGESGNEEPSKPADGPAANAGDTSGEDRAKTPQIADESTAPSAEAGPMHIPATLNPPATNGSTEAGPDAANQTPRNNAGPFVLNGTTGRM
ncbi:hypothetical protein DRE_01765 [Drechslerella stenobrocha 248]|uniref:FHA domain-containing protein n=1 Tax=Drechslerella stenobrocha 248 TaxID=1043628 RepID=W7I8C2_9PEZI|nr:hypothetical protein DRE_01765 [Drechslerella stenobrocha 248]